MTNYEYTQNVRHQIEKSVRQAIPIPRLTLTPAELGDDLKGVDAHYRVNQSCDLQIRCRFDRPAYAADSDVTFRHTEVSMIEQHTYAPLMLFLWFRQGFVVAGKLVDVYRMADNIEPDLRHRHWEKNRRGTPTYWTAVEVAELHKAGALLRQGDDDHWIAVRINGTTDTLRIINGNVKSA
jgi:hypothetical protein